MVKTQLRSTRRGEAHRSTRKTANVSSILMAALEKRGAEEALPVATVVRQAVAQYAQAARAGNLPEVDLDGIEDNVRRGSRGPAAQWPVQVSYVLDEDLSNEVAELAKKEGVGFNDIVRRAVGLAVAREVVPARSPTRLRHGFVTYDDTTRAVPSKRVVVQVLDELRDQ